MNPWFSLAQWAENRRTGMTITLMRDEGEPEGVFAGLMAVVQTPGDSPEGPLTQAPFWMEDWPGIANSLTVADISDEGRLWKNAGRRYYLSPLFYPKSILILGAGHVGNALARLCHFLEFEVTIIDDRPEFLTGFESSINQIKASFQNILEMFPHSIFEAVAVVTRGHVQDTDSLRQLLTWPEMPPYLGMIGSRHRTRETIKMLAEEGFPPERLAKVRTPIGLDIGAQTPTEIAVSIAAEIITELRKGRVHQ